MIVLKFFQGGARAKNMIYCQFLKKVPKNAFFGLSFYKDLGRQNF